MNGEIVTNKKSTLQTYELIDAGNGKRLEKFGQYVLIRPDALVVVSPKIQFGEWQEMADAEFVEQKNNIGTWIIKSEIKRLWKIDFENKDFTISFLLDLSTSKHVGVFPEHNKNWVFIYSSVKEISKIKPVKVLNLFAYTGGASLAARAAGADVTHVEALRQLVNKSAVNMQASGLDGVRWVVEDALRFVKREVKRGNMYQGIILDPPAFGRGPKGEKWILDELLKELLLDVFSVFDKQNGFVVLNTYSPKITDRNIIDYLPKKLDGLSVNNSWLTLESKLGAEIRVSLCTKIYTDSLGSIKA
jgi:23S rRNA (cytosine1962-C5)-methyltransferase